MPCPGRRFAAARLAETKGIADGEDEVPDLQRGRVANGRRLKFAAGHPEEGDIGSGIGSDHLRRFLATVKKRDDNLVGVLDHMIVGQDKPAACIDNHPGSGREYLPLRGCLELR